MTTDTTSTRTTYPLTWLRGIAALAVLTFHAYQRNRSGPDSAWPLTGWTHRTMIGTDLFVDMFFVLSAFVLWLPVARSALAGDRGRPGWLMLFRRLARLLPLYATVVVVVWAITNPRLPGHWQDLVLHLSFTHVYSNTYIFWTDGPAWSLGVELHFYLLIALAIPLVRLVTRRGGSRRARLAALMALPTACAVVGTGYLAWMILHVRPADTDWVAWFNPLAKAPDFALGMTLAVVCAAGVRLPRVARRTAAIVALAALVALVDLQPASGPDANWWHPAFALAEVVGLAAIVLHDGPYPQWMSWRPLAWVGGLGYGIYLLHEPTMRLMGHWGLLPDARPGWSFLATALLVAVPAVTLAWVSSQTIERLGLKLLATVDAHGRPRDYYAHVADLRALAG